MITRTRRSNNPKGRPPEERCVRGHAYAEHGYVSRRGQHVCRTCKREHWRRRVLLHSELTTVERLLRDGLVADSGSAIRSWQRRVWAFFADIETRARTA